MMSPETRDHDVVAFGGVVFVVVIGYEFVGDGVGMMLVMGLCSNTMLM